MATLDRKTGKFVTTSTDRAKRLRRKLVTNELHELNKQNPKITTDEKTGIQRDERGMFVKGTKPRNGFEKRPQDMNKNGGWNKKNTASYQYRRFWAMSSEEFILHAKAYGVVKIPHGESDKTLKKIERIRSKGHTMIEELALRRVLASVDSMSEMREITTRVEGKPTEYIQAKIESKFSKMTEEELEALVRAEYGDE